MANSRAYIPYKPMENSRAYIPKWVTTIDKCDT
jgi:hypothetical protein